MRVIAVFFGPCAPAVLIAYVSVLSHDFKRFDRLTQLATSSMISATLPVGHFPLFAARGPTTVQHLPPQLPGGAVEDFKRRAVLGPQPYTSSPAELCQICFRIKRA
jgi:hypothetical protein